MEEVLRLALDHALGLVTIGLTAILAYRYLWERDLGRSIGKKYRQSIFKAQSKLHLNAGQYFSSRGDILNVLLKTTPIGKETIDVFFTLGKLFRRHGEIDKAIQVHGLIMSKENITDLTRLKALKELAVDYRQAGLLEKALETYGDSVKISPDDSAVLLAMSELYERLGQLDEAIGMRVQLTKVTQSSQNLSLHHLLLDKASKALDKGQVGESAECLEQALRYGPTPRARIHRLKLHLIQGQMEDARTVLYEFVQEWPKHTLMLWDHLFDLDQNFTRRKKEDPLSSESFTQRLELLQQSFLDLNAKELPCEKHLIKSRLQLYEKLGKHQQALKEFQECFHTPAILGPLWREYLKLLERGGYNKEAMEFLPTVFESWEKRELFYHCTHCGHHLTHHGWRCPQCLEWDTIRYNWEMEL